MLDSDKACKRASGIKSQNAVFLKKYVYLQAGFIVESAYSCIY